MIGCSGIYYSAETLSPHLEIKACTFSVYLLYYTAATLVVCVATA